MPRADIRMTDDEARAFLAAKDEAVVVANGPGGGPIATVAPYRLVDGELVLALLDGDPVLAALDADPRVCVVAEQFPSYYEVRSVIVHGHAVLGARDEPAGRRRVHVAVGDDVVSFDFAKMADPT